MMVPINNGRVWSVLIIILCGVSTLALFFAGLGYQSVDKRLCQIQNMANLSLHKVAVLEAHQDQRILREGEMPPKRPTFQDLPPTN
jgi:hypothetical protein